MVFEYAWGESHSVQSIYNWVCRAYGPYVFGVPKKVDFVAFVEHSHVDSYASTEMTQEWRQMSEKLLDKEFTEKLLGNSKKYRENYWNFYNEFKDFDLGSFSNSQLFSLLEKLSSHFQNICVYFVVTQPEGTHAIEIRLKELLQKHYGEKTSEMFALLTMPSELDIICREQLDLWNLALKEELSQRDLEQHAEKHAWLLYQTYNTEKCFEFLRNRIEQEKQIGDLQNRAEEVKNAKRELRAKQEKIFADLNNEEIEWHCKLFQRLAHERLELKNCWAGAEPRFLALFKQIAKRLSIALTDLMYGYTLQETREALFEGKLVDSVLVKERKELYAIRFSNGKAQIYRKSQIPALKKELEINDVPKVEEVSGTIANPGIARGRAYVVKVVGVDQLLEDERNFKEGDIMITTMTQPTHIGIVKKSAAVVADEGDKIAVKVLSHGWWKGQKLASYKGRCIT
ncbi:hypothetical protein HY571_01325, partial [Candidatus Micrarchaeota archaeon]|nr:hypothetical protein [Candidatus Micrarchaeota archaeon]